MTQGIYGMVVAFLIIVFSGIMGGGEALTIEQGFYYVFASLPIALGGWYSALRQGEVAVAGISVLAKQPDAVGKAVISASFVELYAILALLISILLVL
jgi:V/A-type H+-transporting ATPase subunit K